METVLLLVGTFVATFATIWFVGKRLFIDGPTAREREFGNPLHWD